MHIVTIHPCELKLALMYRQVLWIKGHHRDYGNLAAAKWLFADMRKD